MRHSSKKFYDITNETREFWFLIERGGFVGPGD